MDEATRLRKALEEHLNSHGYGFQYAVFAEVVRLSIPTLTMLPFGECRSLSFPVEVNQGHITQTSFFNTAKSRYC